MNLLFVLIPMTITLISLVPILFLNRIEVRENSLPENAHPVPPSSFTSRTVRGEAKSQAMDVLPDSPELSYDIKALNDAFGDQPVLPKQSVYSMVEFIARANMAAQGYLIRPSAGSTHGDE